MSKFTIEGDDTEWEFDENTLFVDEARIIQKHSGYGVNELSQGLQKGWPDALVAMLFLTKRRAGVAVQWKDFDHFNLATIKQIVDDPADDDNDDEGLDVESAPVPPTAAGPEPAPTSASPAGKTRKSGSRAT